MVERQNNGVEMGEVGTYRVMLWKFTWLGQRAHTGQKHHLKGIIHPQSSWEQNNGALGDGVGLKNENSICNY